MNDTDTENSVSLVLEWQGANYRWRRRMGLLMRVEMRPTGDRIPGLRLAFRCRPVCRPPRWRRSECGRPAAPTRRPGTGNSVGRPVIHLGLHGLSSGPVVCILFNAGFTLHNFSAYIYCKVSVTTRNQQNVDFDKQKTVSLVGKPMNFDYLFSPFS